MRPLYIAAISAMSSIAVCAVILTVFHSNDPRVIYAGASAGSSEYNIVNHIQAEDCSGGSCDIAPAFGRVFASCQARYPGASVRTGCSIRIPEGTFKINSTVALCRQYTIRGAGGQGWGARTIINAANNVTAFRVADNEECVAAGLGGGGGWSEISDFALYSTVAASATKHYGVLLNARAMLERLNISGFTVGVKVLANVGGGVDCPLHPSKSQCITNANGWLIRNSRIESSEHASVWVKGSDSNAGLGEFLDIASSCKDDALDGDAELGTCAAIVDASFLGNTWVAVETATSTSRLAVKHRGFDTTNVNAHSTFIGSYGETDQLAGRLSQYSHAFGGINTWEYSGGNWITAGRSNQLTFINNSDPNNTVRTHIGYSGQSGEYMQFNGDLFNNPLRIKQTKALSGIGVAADCNQCTYFTQTINGSSCYTCFDGYFRFDVANLDGAIPFMIDTTSNSGSTIGTFWMVKQPVLTAAGGESECLNNSSHSCP